MDQEKIVAKHLAVKVLVFKIYKVLLKHHNNKANNPIKEWSRIQKDSSLR